MDIMGNVYVMLLAAALLLALESYILAVMCLSLAAARREVALLRERVLDRPPGAAGVCPGC